MANAPIEDESDIDIIAKIAKLRADENDCGWSEPLPRDCKHASRAPSECRRFGTMKINLWRLAARSATMRLRGSYAD
jgi:hypothetical protein